MIKFKSLIFLAASPVILVNLSPSAWAVDSAPTKAYFICTNDEADGGYRWGNKLEFGLNLSRAGENNDMTSVGSGSGWTQFTGLGDLGMVVLHSGQADDEILVEANKFTSDKKCADLNLMSPKLKQIVQTAMANIPTGQTPILKCDEVGSRTSRIDFSVTPQEARTVRGRSIKREYLRTPISLIIRWGNKISVPAKLRSLEEGEKRNPEDIYGLEFEAGTGLIEAPGSSLLRCR